MIGVISSQVSNRQQLSSFDASNGSLLLWLIQLLAFKAGICSILNRQEDGRHRPIMLADDVDALARRCAVAAQQAAAMLQRIIVGLFVFGAECFAPIAAVVPVEVFRQVHIQRKRSGCGVNFP